MPQNPIQWFPGHMAKTRRMMKECLPEVDIVLELLDARIPYSSRNPEIAALLGTKPHVTVLTKTSLADPTLTKKWLERLQEENETAVCVDAMDGTGITALADTVRAVLSQKLDRYKEKGMEGRRIRAMIVGIPNVGKSSLINRLAKSKKAKAENRPGVTLTKQWVPTDLGLDLLDMPGVLWPKFQETAVGENLALTGAIRDAILDTEELAAILCHRLTETARPLFLSRYHLTEEEIAEADAYDLLCLVGKKRGFLVSGGEINTERTAQMLLEEFRSAKIGRITLEAPKKG